METNGTTQIQTTLHLVQKSDHYMKGFNDTLMLLDYLEGEAVIDKGSKELNNAWFKKVDKQLRGANTKNQYDNVRDLKCRRKEYNLTSVNDLVEKNFMTKHGPGNGQYDPTGFGSAYETVPITAGIYGGNTSEGAPGAMSFKHNTFRMWGYFGYEKASQIMLLTCWKMSLNKRVKCYSRRWLHH